MPVQTQESKRAGMDAFLDIYEEFEEVRGRRRLPYGNSLTSSDRIALFAIYIGRME